MNWKIKPIEELCCPKCSGEINTIHPYYSAAEYSKGFNPFIFGLKLILIGIAAEIWWPLGIVLLAWIIIDSTNKPKKAILYKCTKCNLEFSYNDLLFKNNEET